MSGNNPVTFKSAPPKYKFLRIARGKVVKKGGMMGEGIDPNLEEALKEATRRGNKVQGYTVDEARDEYVIRLLVPKAETDGAVEADKPRVFVPESFGGER